MATSGERPSARRPIASTVVCVLLIVVGLALCLIPVGAYCVDGPTSGSCGSIVLWPIGLPLIIVAGAVLIVRVRRRRGR